jgi:hypothetical protein
MGPFGHNNFEAVTKSVVWGCLWPISLDLKSSRVRLQLQPVLYSLAVELTTLRR